MAKTPIPQMENQEVEEHSKKGKNFEQVLSWNKIAVLRSKTKILCDNGHVVFWQDIFHSGKGNALLEQVLSCNKIGTSRDS